MSAGRQGHGGVHDAELERLRRDYTFAFLTYRLEGTEQRLQAAHDLGRKVMASELNLLHLAQVHHEVVAEALLAARDKAALRAVTAAASSFFVEVLSTFEMAQRGFGEIRKASVEGHGPLSPGAHHRPERELPESRGAG